MDDTSGSFFALTKLCIALGEEASYSGKEALLRDFYKHTWKGDIYILLRLLLCKQDLRVYHLVWH
jgi:hypothetical protein